MSEQDHAGMARGRALITDAERDHIAGERGDDQRKYEAVSRVRARIHEELAADVELLAEHHLDLLDELRDVVCGGGRSIYCPICGQEFDQPTNAVHHLQGPTQHDLTVEEVRETIPRWWRDEQETLASYLGEESTISDGG